ncbi:MAG: hypothetical protein WD607_00045 [Candidatus Paceibacterota bacterium]
MMSYDHLLITGAIRSGTTFVGKVIDQATDFRLINEPFSFNHGIEGIQHWNPYTSEYTPYYQKLFKKYFNYKSTFKLYERNKYDKYLKSVIKSRAHFNYLINKYSPYKKKLILKDPLASLSSQYLRHNHNIGVLVLFRHPGAFVYSNKRLEWDFNLEHIFNQVELVERYLKEEQKIYHGNLDYIERLSLLWRCINKVLIEYSKRKDDHYWQIVTHEELCINPQETFKMIFDRFEIDFNERTKDYIRKNTSKSNKINAGKAAHLLKRDSEGLIDYWKRELSEKEIDKIKRLTYDLALTFYDKESWK